MKKLHAAWIAGCLLLLLITTSWGLLYVYASQNKVPGHTVVGGTAIGGLAIDQALDHLEKAWDGFEQREIHITAGAAAADEKTWTLGELGFQVERSEVRSAILKLREGTLLEKAKYRYYFPRSYELKLQWNSKLFEKKIREQWNWLEFSEPANAGREINAADEVIYKPHIDAYRLDVETLFLQIQAWAVTGGHPRPENELFEGNSATISLEVPPKDQTTFQLPLKIIQPAMTLERLQAQGIERKIMSYTTDFTASSSGRAFNVTSTARTLQDWELAPDEIFDYRKVIHTAEEHYGFREAPVILNGELVPGIGGGICQVSSTLYNAVLLAGLEIVERRNHSLPVSYVPLGRDATFADGYLNFRFRNTTGKHLLIRTETKNGKLTVKLFGTMPNQIEYRIESETVRIIEPPVNEVPSAEVPPGGRVTLQEGKPGYEVETVRIKLQDGKEVYRERISKDTYRAQPAIVGIPSLPGGREERITGEDVSQSSSLSQSEKPLIEDGIRLSQS
ncbi:VanW family protein [Paenibacillus abyssi]|uniref:Vancomycin resistance protein n=1 Tax=Paenibacillus abyssi TaxID=1340531 RepID=A0A917D368_9BACL|nr:VanW family protein [Paenibacillus abyssi]GGG06693.1 vancomycin resistance protein [Paenibacillus abyssi]